MVNTEKPKQKKSDMLRERNIKGRSKGSCADREGLGLQSEAWWRAVQSALFSEDLRGQHSPFRLRQR